MYKPINVVGKNISTCDWRKELVNDNRFRSSSAILKKVFEPALLGQWYFTSRYFTSYYITQNLDNKKSAIFVLLASFGTKECPGKEKFQQDLEVREIFAVNNHLSLKKFMLENTLETSCFFLFVASLNKIESFVWSVIVSLQSFEK